MEGNAFKGPPQSSLHLSTADVDFLFSEGMWHTWHKEILLVLLGPLVLAMLVVSAAFVTAPDPERWQLSRRALPQFLSFSPESIQNARAREVACLQVWCYQFMATGAIFSTLMIIPMYAVQANYYSCGKVTAKHSLHFLREIFPIGVVVSNCCVHGQVFSDAVVLRFLRMPICRDLWRCHCQAADVWWGHGAVYTQ